MMPSSNTPFISILLVNYNGKHLLQECLQSLRTQSLRNFETIVIDNNSVDGSLAYLQDNFPEVKCFDAKANLGFAGGNNFGLQFCRGDWVFFLNNDTVLAKDCLEQLLLAIQTLDGVGFGCLMLDYQNPALVDSGGDTIYKAGPVYCHRGYSANDPLFSAPRKVTSICAGAAIWKMSVVKELGGFDEQFFLNFEDLDMGLRARHLGYQLWLVPSARLRHKGSATIGHYTHTSVFYCTRNSFWLRLKNYPLPVLLLTMPGILVTGLLTIIVFTRRGVLWSWIQGRLAQLQGIPSILAKRKQILTNSRLTWREFYNLLRPNWFRERLAQRKGNRR